MIKVYYADDDTVTAVQANLAVNAAQALLVAGPGVPHKRLLGNQFRLADYHEGGGGLDFCLGMARIDVDT